MQEYENKDLIFGLDIGTRTVIGVVGYQAGKEFIAIASKIIPHQERAMMDGQIHDINKVAETVKIVKDELETELGVILEEVAVAAAGRSLTTQMVEVEIHFEEVHEFTQEDILKLELLGVEEAKKIQQQTTNVQEYYCVAYSVIRYYLDEYAISNLDGHKGNMMRAKLIATFLPKIVIDSLYAVTERAALTVTHLTLEPIAAINAVIPEQLRLLNLALVDVGAGTSDIAITKDGTVIAYGMLPIAGDEITETIIHKYLVDFQTAESIKQQLNEKEAIIFEDILGFEQQVSKEEIVELITPSITHLTSQIAAKIKELNGDVATSAVFCVGGGSQMANFTIELAKHMELSEQRVGLRTRKQIADFVAHDKMIDGPDSITPIGIAITSARQKYNQFTTIRINEKQIDLLNTKKLTILDAIIAAQIPYTTIFPKRGETLMFKINGSRIRVKGEPGVVASILLNGKEATINTPIQNQDKMEVIVAKDGENGKACVQEYIDSKKEITFLQQIVNIPIVLINGRYVSYETMIKQNDEVEIIEEVTIGQLMDYLEKTYNDELLYVNGIEQSNEYIIQEGDNIEIIDKQEIKQEKLSKPVLQPILEKGIMVQVNGETVYLPPKNTPYMFANIFDYISFDLTKQKGTVQLLRNGRVASVTETLCDRDKLEIFWKN